MPDAPLPPVGTPDSNPPGPDSTGLAPNVAAALAFLFIFVGGIVFLVLERRDKFVRFWAMQSIFFGGLAVAVWIVTVVASFIFGVIPWVGVLLVGVVWIANLVFGIGWLVGYLIGAVKAFSGQEWEIPWIGKLARKQLAQTDGPAAQ